MLDGGSGRYDMGYEAIRVVCCCRVLRPGFAICMLMLTVRILGVVPLQLRVMLLTLIAIAVASVSMRGQFRKHVRQSSLRQHRDFEAERPNCCKQSSCHISLEIEKPVQYCVDLASS